MNGQQPIRLRQLRLRHQQRVILDNIDIELRPGELTLLTGPNGSGKTTLQRVISGLQRPDTLQLELNGKWLDWRRAKSLLRNQICYLHQQPYLFDGSVFDNIAYGLRQRGTARGQIERRVSEALEHVSLEPLLHRPSHELSGGEKQRVAIARAWALSPLFMLLDEPVANLDKHSRQQCHQLINELPSQGIGVVLTSHEPQHGELKFTRHLHLYQGRLGQKMQRVERTSSVHITPPPRHEIQTRQKISTP